MVWIMTIPFCGIELLWLLWSQLLGSCIVQFSASCVWPIVVMGSIMLHCWIHGMFVDGVFIVLLASAIGMIACLLHNKLVVCLVYMSFLHVDLTCCVCVYTFQSSRSSLIVSWGV